MHEGVSSAAASPRVGEPSRRRIVGAFAVVTLTPVVVALLAVENVMRWNLNREEAAAAAIASAAIFARALGLSGRWLMVGPGEVIDRRLWGWFLLLASAIVVERLFGFGTGFLAGGYALACMIFWSLSRREDSEGRPESTKSRFSLRDAFVALGLFSVLAWLLATRIDWRESETLAGGPAWIAAFPLVTFPALVGYLSDAAFRDAFLKPRRAGRKKLYAVATIAAILLWACCVALAFRENVHLQLALPIFVSVYVLTAVVQESALAWAGVGEGEAPVQSNPEANPKASASSGEEP